MADHITITPAEGTWSIRAAGAVLGESTSVLELREEGYDPVIYFPRDDISMAFFEKSEKISTCPHKGDATYFNLVAKSGTIPNAAWSYEDPKEAVVQIKGHLAFYSEHVEVEQI